MFGYVTINHGELSEEEYARYRSYYCGLCRSLKRRHGVSGQLVLSYDMVFLQMLLTSLYEAECQSGTSRCVPHPTKPHAWLTNGFSDYCADMSIALSYYNLLDNWEDEHSAPSLALARQLRKKYDRVSARYPRQCAAIHYCLTQLDRCEKENCQDMDVVSGHFGQLMAELLDARRDVWSADLQEMGMALGKFIYLMDAYEDLRKDQKKHRYNPLAGLARQPDYEQQVHDILVMLMAQCASAFERLPILQDAGILRNILYSGVWTRYTELRHLQQKARGKAES